MNNFRLELIIGCMYSGKSTELLRRCLRYKAIGKKIILINHINDTRTDKSIKTHENNKYDALKYNNLLDFIKTDWEKYDIIGIDEAQFFPDLEDFILYSEKNKTIIIAGLDGDSERKPFGQILQCIPLSDSVIKLTAMDMISLDGTDAIFTKRIITNNTNEQICIGSKDKYIAVSRNNYLK